MGLGCCSSQKVESVKPIFKVEGDESVIPIARTDSSVVLPDVSNVTGEDTSESKESDKFDQSLHAQRMIRGGYGVSFSHLFFPFTSSNLKGAYICINKWYGPQFLVFSFTLSSGEQRIKKYKFKKFKCNAQWLFLPIDLHEVTVVEIEGTGMWNDKKCGKTYIDSLVFISEDSPSSPKSEIQESEESEK
ncbi:hypothetical protein ADUPG1_006425 [Aduncisulcus paluster]|uniref:Uncharacterized protein n=1 Tax=Aduncisulcus paluster TaxID=2918883 RepID=A0ABQ5KL79_9EUKA|nr:hypothetical protein ADUPG1_006425 [Aduncisulcus paluster]